MQRKLIISLILAILVAIFALQNSAEVVIKLWFWSAQTSLALVLILTFAAGALVGLLFSISARKRKNKSEPTSPNTHEVPLEVNPAETQAEDQHGNIQNDFQGNPRKKGGDPEFEDVIN